MITLLLLLSLAFGGFALLLVLGIGIFEAPWPVLLGILVIGLLAIQWIASQGQAIASAPLQEQKSSADSDPWSTSTQLTTQSDGEPHLVYRGIPYKDGHHDDVQLEEGDPATVPASDHDSKTHDSGTESIQGVYRGQHWHRENTMNPTQEVPLPDITYRGQKVNRPHQ